MGVRVWRIGALVHWCIGALGHWYGQGSSLTSRFSVAAAASASAASFSATFFSAAASFSRRLASAALPAWHSE